jgi:hypothetical protein
MTSDNFETEVRATFADIDRVAAEKAAAEEAARISAEDGREGRMQQVRVVAETAIEVFEAAERGSAGRLRLQKLPDTSGVDLILRYGDGEPFVTIDFDYQGGYLTRSTDGLKREPSTVDRAFFEDTVRDLIKLGQPL